MQRLATAQGPAPASHDAALVARFGPRITRALAAFRSDTSYAEAAATHARAARSQAARTSDDGNSA